MTRAGHKHRYLELCGMAVFIRAAVANIRSGRALPGPGGPGLPRITQGSDT